MDKQKLIELIKSLPDDAKFFILNDDRMHISPVKGIAKANDTKYTDSMSDTDYIVV